MLLHLKKLWDEREAPFAPASGPRFYTFFQRYQADVVKYHMRKDLREVAGLAVHLLFFMTNPSGPTQVNRLMLW